MGGTGAIAVFFASYLGILTWVLFVAWVSYYLFGANVKTAALTLIQQTLGICIAIIIQYAGIYLSEYSSFLGFPIAVLLVMIGVFYISKLKFLNNTPAYFLGMIVWFGADTDIALINATWLVTTLFLGYLFAWINLALSNRIEPKSI